MNKLSTKLKNTKASNLWLYVLLAFLCIGSVIFIQHNHSLYDRPIAKVTEIEAIERNETTDVHGNEDVLVLQQLTAILQNGSDKGKRLEMTNEYSASGAYDQQYHVGNELFVAMDELVLEDGSLTGEVIDVKRDRYVVIIAWIFILTLLIIGRKRGLFALVSFTLNVLLLSFALDLYVHYFSSSLLLIAGICILLFTSISLLLVSGFTPKTYAAIVSTLIGTVVSLAIATLAIWSTSGSGLHYEEMQFLSRPYRTVFLAGLFIGSLGAIMDVSITISSALFTLYEQNPEISEYDLRVSGKDIGRDLMGTITSILFFAYLSGSLPMLILYVKNAAPLDFALPMNLSLEVARALTGGIGVVLTIPIALHTVLFFIKRKRAVS